MGVKIKKRAGKWYVFVNYRGRRKAKCVGTRAAAEQVKMQLEAKFALGDQGFLSADEKTIAFGEYADRWLKQHAEQKCKLSTVLGYTAMLRLHVRPSFENVSLDRISRISVKELFANLSAKGLSAGVLKNALIVLRAILSGAVEDGLIVANPASRMGKFLPTDEQEFEATALTRDEAEAFLDAVDPAFHLFYLTLLRTGLRYGEAVALVGVTSSWDRAGRIRTASFGCAVIGFMVDLPVQRVRSRDVWIYRSNSDGHCSKPGMHACSRLCWRAKAASPRS